MFDSIVSGALSIIFGLFLIAMMWNIFGDFIKDFFEDIGSMFKKKN
jgi:hypothetical protein